ncbi:MAG: hypothetical protein AAGE18_14105 [Pseudomonadota bacterium]
MSKSTKNEAARTWFRGVVTKARARGTTAVRRFLATGIGGAIALLLLAGIARLLAGPVADPLAVAAFAGGVGFLLGGLGGLQVPLDGPPDDLRMIVASGCDTAFNVLTHLLDSIVSGAC